MELYCWGNTSHGQLGLGGIEEEQVGVEQNRSKNVKVNVCLCVCLPLFRY